MKHESHDGSQVQSMEVLRVETVLRRLKTRCRPRSMWMVRKLPRMIRSSSSELTSTILLIRCTSPEHTSASKNISIEARRSSAPALDRSPWQLSDLEDISTKIRFIALEAWSANPFVLASPLFELENLQRITLVYGNDRCRADELDYDSYFNKEPFLGFEEGSYGVPSLELTPNVGSGRWSKKSL